MTMASLWVGPTPLLLASSSRTRMMLLESAGLPIEITAPGIDERAVEEAASATGVGALALAERLAREKAVAVSRGHPQRLVLGADQVLELDGEIFHKPADRVAAAAHLQRLAGRTHALHSAGALARDGDLVEVFADTALLTLRPLEPQDIELYLDLAGAEALQSVGAYQVEGLGIHLFEDIAGDHSTILGLPLRPLLVALRRLGSVAL
jgi:septum formation protein